MPNNNRKCDDCKQVLDGACFVDGSLLLCADCAENLDNEREANESFDYGDSDLDYYMDDAM